MSLLRENRAYASAGTVVSPAFLLAAYFLSAVGELCLSPVGLSTFSAVAPERVIGQAMGVWFLSMALGNLTAGRVLALAGQVSGPTFALGMALACVTNKPGAFALDLLERKGLRHWFAAVHGGDAFARRKPDPLPLVETCRGLGTTPARTLMVGDSDAAGSR